MNAQRKQDNLCFRFETVRVIFVYESLKMAITISQSLNSQPMKIDEFLGFLQLTYKM